MARRPQVENLRPISGSGITGAARPSDSVFTARSGRISLQLTNFETAIRGGLHGVSQLIASGAEEDRQRGFTHFQEELAEAESASKSTQEALAGLVAKGDLLEEHNPAFQIGYRKALAREVAARWALSTRAQIDGEAQEALLPDQEIGVPAASRDPGTISAQTLSGLRDHLAKVNPNLASDPWFRDELAREQGRLSPQLAEYGQQVQSQALKQATRDQLRAELSGLMGEIATGRTDGEGLSEWVSANIHRGGIKNPHAFVYEAAKATYLELLNATGPDGKAVKDAGERARDGLVSLGNIKVNGVTLAKGSFGDEYQALMRQAFSAQESDSQNRRARHAEEVQEFLESWESDGESLLSQVFRAPSLATADSLIEETRTKLFAPGPWNPEDRFGVPSRELAPEALGALLEARSAVKSARSANAPAQLAEALEALDGGEFEKAELAAANLPPAQRVEYINQRRSAKSVSRHLDGPLANRWWGELNSLKSGIQTGTAASDQEVAQSVDAKLLAFRRKARDVLAEAGPSEREALMAGELTDAYAALKESIRTEVTESSDAYRGSLRPILDGWTRNKNMTGEIQALFDSGKLDEETYQSLLQQNTSQTATAAKWTSATASHWRAVEGRLRETITNSSLFQLSGTKAVGPFVDAAWIKVTNSTPPLSLGVEPRLKAEITPAGEKAIRQAVGVAQRSLKAWLGGEEAAALKRSHGAGGLSVKTSEVYTHILDRTLALIGDNPAGFTGEELIEPDLESTRLSLGTPIDPPIKSGEEPAPLPEESSGTDEGSAGAPASVSEEVIEPPPSTEEPITAGLVDPGIRDATLDQASSTIADMLATEPAGIPAFGSVWDKLLPEWAQGDMSIPRSISKSIPKEWSDRRVIRETTGNRPGAPGFLLGNIFQKSSTLENYVGSFGHPYFHQLATLRAASLKPKGWERVKAFGQDVSATAISRIIRSPKAWVTQEDTEYAFHNAFRLYGVPHQDILKGRLKVRNSRGKIRAGLDLKHPEWIQPQITPLFSSVEELEAVAKNTGTMQRLFSILAIPHSTGVPLELQAGFSRFLEQQKAAIRRIN